MTSRSTAAELQVSRSSRLAFVILIEGIPVAFTTSEDVTGVAGAWAATEWNASAAAWYPTAFLPGAWSQQIELFNPKIRADSISFEVVDRKRWLAGFIFGQQAATARTYLDVDLDNDDTAIVVKETAGFPGSGSGYLYIGNETIYVDHSADQTPTGWNTSERGKWALHSTESAAPFSPSHLTNVANKSKPRVTDKPVTWYNRRVAIYAHHYEAGSRTWSLASQALLVWEGFLRPATDTGKATVVFSAVHAMSALTRELLQHQFTADVAEGREIVEGRNRVIFGEAVVGNTPYIYRTTIAAGWYSAERMGNAINAAISVAGLDYAWSLGHLYDDHYGFEAFSQPGDMVPVSYKNSIFEVGLSDDVWDLLGFATTGGSNWTVQEATGTYSVRAQEMKFAGLGGSGQAFYRRVAEQMPLLYHFQQSSADLDPTASVRLSNESGEFVTQPTLQTDDPNPFGVAGYLKFGAMEIIGGTYDPGTHLFRMTQKLHHQLPIGGLETFVAGAIKQGWTYRVGDPAITAGLTVSQVWYESAPVGELFLRLLLSTGTLGYNSADFDVNPAGMGAALPWSLLDVDSFKALGPSTWTLYIDKPRELARELESMLASFGRYLVWARGKITLVSPRVDGPAIATAYALTEDNKARTNDRVTAEYAGDAVVNRAELKYNRAADGSFRSTTAIDDVVSQSDFGLQRTVSIEAFGVQNREGRGLPDMLRLQAALVLAFFSRPMTVVERTFTKAMISMAPGDTVLLTDNYLIDPRSGLPGLAEYPAWVLSAKFDPQTMIGTCRLAYSAEFTVDKICQWAWSARVNDGAANAGYTVVDPDTRYIEVFPSAYRGLAQAADDTGVAVGDKIRIRELSPANPYAPLFWQAEVESVDTVMHRIYLTAALVGWDATLLYIVTPDVITTVVNDQRINTFIADDDTDSTGFLANDAYVYGLPKFLAPTSAPVMTQSFVRPPLDGQIDGAGYPLAIGDLTEAMKSANVLLAYRTRHLAWSQVWTHATAQTSTADKELVAGPIWIPLYGRGVRNLLVRLYGMTEDVLTPAEFTITTSREMPQGEAGLVVGFPDIAFALQVMVSTSSATLEWMDEVEVECSPQLGHSPLGVWLSIECETGDAGVAGILRGATVFEAAGT